MASSEVPRGRQSSQSPGKRRSRIRESPNQGPPDKAQQRERAPQNPNFPPIRSPSGADERKGSDMGSLDGLSRAPWNAPDLFCCSEFHICPKKLRPLRVVPGRHGIKDFPAPLGAAFFTFLWSCQMGRSSSPRRRGESDLGSDKPEA